jgi:hypothetical protein
MNSSSAPETLVREAVVEADRRRRARDARAELAKLAPAAAGVALVTAVMARLAGWPVAVPIAVLGVLAVALAARTYLLGRARVATDLVASRVDADADLRGELRSAHWFAASDKTEDPWAAYHLAQAADHAGRVAWQELYPPVRASKAWAASALLAVAALTVSIYSGGPLHQPTEAEALAAELAAMQDELPADLQQKLADLLAAMDDGTVTSETASETLKDLKDLLAQLDPALQQKLAELAEDRQLGSDDGAPRNLDAGDQSDDAENSAAGMPEDVKWALEDLAARLANSNADRQTNADNPSASSETGETAIGSAQAEAQDGKPTEGGMQMMRQSATDAGEAAAMMAGAGAMGGDSSGGEGGNSGKGSGDKEFQSIAQALRQELIEAARDMTQGQNVQTEDIRRKTEQGTSTLGFTRVAPPATFDRSRVVGPPPVPDARRPLLFNYFIRER